MNLFFSWLLRSLAVCGALSIFAAAAPSAHAQYGNMAFTVAPGGVIYIQNLSGAGWYYYNDPIPSSATMARVSEDFQQTWAWGSAEFKRDLNGWVSKVNPREWLRVNAGNTPTGSVIRITYHDSSFDSNYSLDITVQSASAQVLSINRLDPNPSTTSSVRWEITFDKAVAGVRAQNLALAFTYNGQAAPTITNIAPSGLAHTKWTVTASTVGRDAGTVALNWTSSSIERPHVQTAFSGQSYNIEPPPPTTFSAGRYDTIDIRNVTDEGWYFTEPPALATTTMYRLSEDNSTAEPWNSENFGPDITGSGRNKIARNQSLRIYTGDTPIGSTIVVNYVTSANVAKSISIVVTTAVGKLLSMTRLDPSPTSSKTLRWLLTFDRPVAGIQHWNIGFTDYAGVRGTITGLAPDAASGFRKWTLTAQLNGDGVGPFGPVWSTGFTSFHPESPYVANTVTPEYYDLNPLIFNVPPGGSIDIENFYMDRLRFKAGPSPSSAQMFRLSRDTISVTPWGAAGFHYIDNSNTSNYVQRYEYLRVTAGSTPTNSVITMQAYRTVSPDDPGFAIRVKVEVPDAQVLSADIIDPSPTVANTVRWDVTFNKTMSNVTPANFRFINTAQLQPTPTITSVVPVPNTSNTKWRVTVDTTGTGTGLLGLRYIGHAIESPHCPNTFTGQFYDFSSYPLMTADPTPLSAIIVTGGEAPALSVTATIRTGETLHYHWRQRLGSTPHFEDPVVGTGPSFTPPTDVAGHRTYYCRVFTMNPNTGEPSGYYAHSLPATMHVYDPPEIVTQPADIGLPPGGSGTIPVGAIGSELQFQWYRGQAGDRSQPIANTNAASYTTPALTQNAQYWVLVSNPLGAAYELESRTVTARVVAQVLLAQDKFTPLIDTTVEQMKARALDAEGNPAPNASITFSGSISGVIGGLVPAGNFDGRLAIGGSAAATATTDAEGWATAPPMWTNTKAGAYEVVAKSQGPTVAITAAITIENQPGVPAAFAWVTQPSANATAGVPFATQPKLTVHDAWENPVTRVLTFVAEAHQSLGVLQGTTTIESASGEVAFTDLAHHTAGKLKVRISCGEVVAISNEITVVPGPVALITAVAGTPQGTHPGDLFALPLTAKLSDTYGNGIAGSSVKFQGAIQNATASFPEGDTVVTDAFGQAAVVARASSFSGTHDVTAVAPQHAAITGAVFHLWNFNNLQAWRADNFSGAWENSGNAANGAMPFGDGVPNLLKYAFNLNAKAADHALMTADGVRGLPLVGMDEQGRLTVTFVRRKASTFPNIVYTVQFSDELVGTSFAVNPNATTSAPVSIDATWERVTVTDSVSAPDATPKRFARVQVSEL